MSAETTVETIATTAGTTTAQISMVIRKLNRGVRFFHRNAVQTASRQML